MAKRWLQLGALAGVALAARAMVRRHRSLEVRGRVVAITGGSRGLGLVLARELVDRGAIVAICARDSEELARARVDLEQRGGTVFTAICDVTDPDDVYAFVTAIEDEVGPIDVLVNNAGIMEVGPIELMTSADFERVLATNLRGPMTAALGVLPGMRKRKRGRIVNIASIGGKLAFPHLAPYTTSKFALVGFSEALRVEVAKDNIFVTTVCPGLMRTGSPRHALFKGEQDAEYAWFTVADSSALTSVSAEHAARTIIRAFMRGQAEVVISPQARVASFLHGVAPGFMANVMGVVARILPPPTGSKVAIPGLAIDQRAPDFLVRNSDEAAAANNELVDP